MVEALDGPFVLSPFVLAELDYMLIERHGQERQLALLSEVVDGAYELAEFGRDDVEAAAVVMKRYADLRVGLADASIVVLAEKHGIVDVLTFDQRHFRTMSRPGGASIPATSGRLPRLERRRSAETGAAQRLFQAEWRGGKHLRPLAAGDVQPDAAGGGDDHAAAAEPEEADARLPARRLPDQHQRRPADRLLPGRLGRRRNRPPHPQPGRGSGRRLDRPAGRLRAGNRAHHAPGGTAPAPQGSQGSQGGEWRAEAVLAGTAARPWRRPHHLRGRRRSSPSPGSPTWRRSTAWRSSTPAPRRPSSSSSPSA